MSQRKIHPGDLVTVSLDYMNMRSMLLLATAIRVDPVIDGRVQTGMWLWDGDVIEVDGEVCMAIAHLDMFHDGNTPIYVIHPNGIGWVDTSEVVGIGE